MQLMISYNYQIVQMETIILIIPEKSPSSAISAYAFVMNELEQYADFDRFYTLMLVITLNTSNVALKIYWKIK